MPAASPRASRGVLVVDVRRSPRQLVRPCMRCKRCQRAAGATVTVRQRLTVTHELLKFCVRCLEVGVNM